MGLCRIGFRNYGRQGSASNNRETRFVAAAVRASSINAGSPPTAIRVSLSNPAPLQGISGTDLPLGRSVARLVAGATPKSAHHHTKARLPGNDPLRAIHD